MHSLHRPLLPLQPAPHLAPHTNPRPDPTSSPVRAHAFVTPSSSSSCQPFPPPPTCPCQHTSSKVRPPPPRPPQSHLSRKVRPRTLPRHASPVVQSRPAAPPEPAWAEPPPGAPVGHWTHARRNQLLGAPRASARAGGPRDPNPRGLGTAPAPASHRVRIQIVGIPQGVGVAAHLPPPRNDARRTLTVHTNVIPY